MSVILIAQFTNVNPVNFFGVDLLFKIYTNFVTIRIDLEMAKLIK
jgi:hypothetical protein